MKKLLVPEINLTKEEKDREEPVGLANYFNHAGADAMILYDCSADETEHTKNLQIIRQICRESEIPQYCGGNINREEDVEQLLQTGCEKVILNFSKENNREMLKKVSERFGKERIAASVDCKEQLEANNHALEQYASMVIAMRDLPQDSYYKYPLPIIAGTAKEGHDIFDILEKNAVMGVTGEFVSRKSTDFMLLKNRGHQMGVETNVFRSEILWNELRLNREGVVPVVVQHYRTKEVLMLLYMTEEAFQKTLETGVMHYYSRSRKRIYTKNRNDGSIQYVKSLTADGDYDTILAEVCPSEQFSSTGHSSSFFNRMFRKEMTK